MLKKAIILFLLVAVELQAQSALAWILLIPDNAKAVIGISAGMVSLDQQVHIDSTDPAQDGLRFGYHQTNPDMGLLLGLENDRYGIDIAFDSSAGNGVSMQQLLFGFKYKFLQENTIHPMLGVNVGVTDSKLEIPDTTVTFSNGTYAVDAGVEFRQDDRQAIEIMMRYSRFLNAGSDTRTTETDFTSYNLHEQNSLSIRFGYRYRF